MANGEVIELIVDPLLVKLFRSYEAATRLTGKL